MLTGITDSGECGYSLWISAPGLWTQPPSPCTNTRPDTKEALKTGLDNQTKWRATFLSAPPSQNILAALKGCHEMQRGSQI